MTTVRVQGPEGSQSLELAADATVGDLKDAIADKLGIPTATQTLLTGFPPSTLTADDGAALAATLGAAPRVLVRRAAGRAATARGARCCDVRARAGLLVLSRPRVVWHMPLGLPC